MKPVKHLLGAALAVLAVVAAPAFAQAKLEKPDLTLAVGGKSLFYYLPLTVAEGKGFFKDEGLNLKIVNFPGGSKALQAMVGGSADMVSGAYEHTINMQAKGIPIKAVVAQGRYSGIVLGVHKSKIDQYRSPQDIKGWKVGVTAPGSSTNMFVNNLLTKNGLKPNDVSIIGVGATGGAVAAMQKGGIDAISNLDPVITRLEAGGDIVVKVDTRTAEGMKQAYGSAAYIAGCIYLPEEFIRKNPNTVQAVVNAMVRANLWLQTASDKEVMAVVPPEYYADDAGLYRVGLIKNLPTLSPDGQLSMEAAKNVYAVLQKFEPSVQKAGNIDLAKTFDNSFVKKALQKYK